MATKYVDELSKWAEKRAETKKRQDAATVAFLAVKSDVIDSIEAGFALTTIYEHMHEKEMITCSYETFRKHVKKHITDKPKASAVQAVKNESKEPKKEVTNRDPKKQKPEAEGFKFNSTPDKKDLI